MEITTLWKVCTEEERAIFEEGFQLINTVQREEWVKAVENAKDRAQNEQHVEFIYPDQGPFMEACMPHARGHAEPESGSGPDTYDAIQAYNEQYPRRTVR